MANRLVSENSPYLLKHRNNPVDWWPWGEEALAEAKRLDCPVFISIGYFSCHWCSVMERESFEDSATAAYMNENFVNIKVDREEYPDVDKIYQRYYNALTGQGGGWPLSVYAFPDGVPFFIGTYFPKKPNLLSRTRSFMSMNKEIVESWETQRNQLEEIATGLFRNLDSSNAVLISTVKPLTDDIYSKEVERVQPKFDLVNGGLVGAPKFPRFSLLRFLLHHATENSNDNLQKFVLFSVRKMLHGGIYDQLGGGLSRYSVDEKWEIPHFEKMLYDNAGLLSTLADIRKLTNHPLYNYYIEDLLHFLDRDMKGTQGGYYSSLDAESEGIEGKFYAWSKKEVAKVIKSSKLIDDSNSGVAVSIANLRYGFKSKGNFSDPSGKIKNLNIPKLSKSIGEIANLLELPEEEVIEYLNLIRQLLFQHRENRIKPSVDEKILTSWNAMTLTSLLKIYEGDTQNHRVKDEAVNTLEFLLKQHVKENILLRSKYPTGKEIPATLDDYAFMIESLIQAFETLNKWKYVIYADNLIKEAQMSFYDDEQKIFVMNNLNTGIELGNIVSAMDDSFSSSLAIMLKNLYKLGRYMQKHEYINQGKEMTERLVPAIEKYEAAFSELLLSARYYSDEIVEFVLTNPGIISIDYDKINNAILQAYAPIRLIFRWPAGDNRPFWDILEHRVDGEKATLYVCRGQSCSLPATNLEEVNNVLAEWLTDEN